MKTMTPESKQCSAVHAALLANTDKENAAKPVRVTYLTGVKLEKSAQPVSELGLAGGEALHAASGRASVEGVEDDRGETAAGLLGLAAEAVDVPVSMGMSSKLAVHTGPASNYVMTHVSNCHATLPLLEMWANIATENKHELYPEMLH